jgi:hypothetical protein
MGTKYTTIASSGYDSTPPADDGTVSEANKVKWSTIKTKLSGPVKTLADAINTALVTHFDNGPVAYTSNQTLGATHYGKIIQVSGSGVTLSLTDAATLGAGWYCRIVNTDTANAVTIGRATGGDTINAVAADYSLIPQQTIYVFVIAAATGFRVSATPSKHRGALVKKSADQTFTTAVAASVTWDQETYDTDSIHDTVTNNARLTVPSGVTKVILRGGVVWEGSSAGYRQILIQKNGAVMDGRPVQYMSPSTTDVPGMNITTPVLVVTATDYFTLEALQTSGGNLKVQTSTASWFEMQIIE